MTVKKLSDSDKQEILNLYRQTGETTSTLAERYGVSNSTISRLLKSTLPEEEYEALISLKRAARTPGGGDATSYSQFSESEPEVLVAPSTEADTIEDDTTTKRRRRRSSASELDTEPATQVQLQLLDTSSDIEDSSAALIENVENQAIDNAPPELPSSANFAPEPITTSLSQSDLERPAVVNSNSRLAEDASAEASAVAEMLGEDLLDESEELMELEEDEDEDLEDLDEDDLDEDTSIITRRVPSEMLVQVLPLSEALLPKTCYLVIDRASELITRPLRDFGDLGQIPSQEVQQKTLPVFDNHRVARRFSTKRDRVIKVPDSRMLQKARSHLQAKGITRLLIDGQVYSLSSN